MARETILDDLIEKRIVDALKAGHSFAAAARAGGIGETTLHEWIARGRGTHPTRPEDERFAKFAKRVEDAEHTAEDRAVQVLQNALTGDDMKLAADTAWKWLARRRPAQWAEQKGEPPPTEQEVAELVEKIRAVR